MIQPTNAMSIDVICHPPPLGHLCLHGTSIGVSQPVFPPPHDPSHLVVPRAVHVDEELCHDLSAAPEGSKNGRDHPRASKGLKKKGHLVGAGDGDVILGKYVGEAW